MTKDINAGLASKIAAQEWSEHFADVLACFDADTVNNALYGHFVTCKHADQEISYAELSRAFLELVDRNVLVPEFRSDLGDEGMEEMRARFGKQTLAGGVPQATSLTPAQRESALVDECSNDYRLLDGTSFKRKWMGLTSRRDVYEQAIAAGKI